MTKKLLSFLVAAFLTTNAWAGFVQYDFANVRFDDGGTVSGFFVQDRDTRAIVFYDFFVTGGNFNAAFGGGQMHFSPSGQFDNLLGVSSSFPSRGPTNFSAFDDLTDAYFETIGFTFGATVAPDYYTVSGWNAWRPIGELSHMPGFTPGQRTIVSGFVNPGAVQNDALLAALELYGSLNGIYYMIPAGTARVPEPGSYALLLVGIGAVAASRRLRRKRAAA